MAKRVVITGPTGTVGMALIDKCLREECEILVICHRGSSRNKNIPINPRISIVEADLCELRSLDLFMHKDYNIFYHLAWNGTFGSDRDNMQLQIKNIQYTMDAVKLAEYLGCKTFIGIGSQAEYGRAEGILHPDTPVFPESGYGMAKLCAGQMSRAECRSIGMNHIWVRILSVYGPYDRKETMISSSLSRMLDGRETYFTAGEQIWDYIYSEDAADALFRIGQNPVSGRVYCLGSGQAFPLKDFIIRMKEETGCRADVHLGAVDYAPNQVMHLCADISDLTMDTGFIPLTDFKTGIRKTIEWKKKHEKD